MRKNYNQEETQQRCHQVSEPVVAYGTETNVNTLKQQPSSRERIMANTTPVGEYFDKVLKRDMTPEELYSVIVDDVKAIVEEEIITDERGRIIFTEPANRIRRLRCGPM